MSREDDRPNVVVRTDSRRSFRRVEARAAQWPRVFLLSAGAIAIVCALCAAGGLRHDVAIVCGMTPASNVRALLGVIYIGSHLALVAVAPILALAACFGMAVHRRV